MPNQSYTSLCRNCLWMTKRAFKRIMDWKQGQNTWLFQSADLTVLRLLFTLHKIGGITVKTTTIIWSKELNMQLSQTPVVLIWACQKCNHFIQVCNYKWEPYYPSPTTKVIPTDCPSFYILFHAPSIHYQETTKIKDSGN